MLTKISWKFLSLFSDLFKVSFATELTVEAYLFKEWSSSITKND